MHSETSNIWGPVFPVGKSAPNQAGRLICLASRNASAEDVLSVFRDRPECVLQLQQLVAWEVHLGAKPESLQRLSTKLGLSLDSFVFLDDNFFEVEDVSRGCPEVLLLHVPQKEEDFKALLQHSWVLDAHGTQAGML